MKNKTIILSIHPRHVDRIMSGEKLYEYRKRVPVDIKYLVVYATAPVKKIVAFIEIDSVLKNTPQYIWENTQEYAGISYEFFMEYYRGKTEAYAIKFHHIYKLPTPVDIATINGINSAPQAYSYINESCDDLFNKFGITSLL